MIRLNKNRLKSAVKNNRSRTKAFKAYFSNSPSWTRRKIEWFDEQIVLAGLDTSHWTGLRGVGREKQYKRTTEEILIENSPANPLTVRRRIIRENLLPYVCSLCGQEPFWNGRALTLQLDHKNGIKKDARISNLRFLCPNCHAQTDTWGPSNRIKKLPDEETLLELAKTMTNTAIAKIYEVNPSSVSNKLFRHFARNK